MFRRVVGCGSFFSHRREAFIFLPFTRFNMARSRSWYPLAGNGLGLFMLLIAACLFINSVSGQMGDPDYTCSATKACALGCCGQNGVCGMGPDYCSTANCINSCNAKSECDPSNWGPQYAASEKCPLNVRPKLPTPNQEAVSIRD